MHAQERICAASTRSLWVLTVTALYAACSRHFRAPAGAERARGSRGRDLCALPTHPHEPRCQRSATARDVVVSILAAKFSWPPAYRIWQGIRSTRRRCKILSAQTHWRFANMCRAPTLPSHLLRARFGRLEAAAVAAGGGGGTAAEDGSPAEDPAADAGADPPAEPATGTATVGGAALVAKTQPGEEGAIRDEGGVSCAIESRAAAAAASAACKNSSS